MAFDDLRSKVFLRIHIFVIIWIIRILVGVVFVRRFDYIGYLRSEIIFIIIIEEHGNVIFVEPNNLKRHFCIGNTVKSLIIENRLWDTSAEHYECAIYVLLWQVYLLVKYEFFELFLCHNFWSLIYSFEKIFLLLITESLGKITNGFDFLFICIYDRILLEICHQTNRHIKGINFFREINFQSCYIRLFFVSFLNYEPSKKNRFILSEIKLLLKDLRQLVYLNGAIRLVITLQNLAFYLIKWHPFDLQQVTESLKSFLDGWVL